MAGTCEHIKGTAALVHTSTHSPQHPHNAYIHNTQPTIYTPQCIYLQHEPTIYTPQRINLQHTMHNTHPQCIHLRHTVHNTHPIVHTLATSSHNINPAMHTPQHTPQSSHNVYILSVQSPTAQLQCIPYNTYTCNHMPHNMHHTRSTLHTSTVHSAT